MTRYEKSLSKARKMQAADPSYGFKVAKPSVMAAACAIGNGYRLEFSIQGPDGKVMVIPSSDKFTRQGVAYIMGNE